jgi:hypothetical protein
MNDHVRQFEQRLIGLFELKAQEFKKYSEEDASSAVVAAQLAGLYSELVQVMKA